MSYLLDANVFIQAKSLHYGLDFCPAFWDWLVEGNGAQKVFSIEKVGDEIDAGYVELGEIGLPDIQRPFVWKNAHQEYTHQRFEG